MATLVANYGGRPLSAPALREVPLESNTEALAFIDALVRDEFDLVILLTGVGTRALTGVVDQLRDRPAFVAALSRTRIAARGPVSPRDCFIQNRFQARIVGEMVVQPVPLLLNAQTPTVTAQPRLKLPFQQMQQ